MSQKALLTPTPPQQVLGVSNGPKRIQRPVSQQKPVSHVGVVKSMCSGDQNVNPATQPKPGSQQKMIEPKVKPERTKPATESEKPEKSQSKYSLFFCFLIEMVISCVRGLEPKCPFFPLLLEMPAKPESSRVSDSKYV